MLTLKRHQISYDLYPKIVPVGKPVTFTLKYLDPDLLFGSKVHLDAVPINHIRRAPKWEDIEYEELTGDEKGFRFTLTPETEQEYLIYVKYEDDFRPTTMLSFYAVEDDLLQRSPLVGDLHSHSYFSDGKEGPAAIAAECRRNGYDFTAITDHFRREPSLRAVKAFEGVDIPFKVYPGEEVHPSHIYTHIVNFASDNSANAYVLKEHPLPQKWPGKTETEAWQKELPEIIASLDDVPEGVEAKEIASAMIVSRVIREGGGMAIFAHPHWLYPMRNANDTLSRYLIKKGIVDAVELTGGLRWDENQTQVAMFEEMFREEGVDMPVVGSSDQHSTMPGNYPGDRVCYFTESKTILFAHENTREGIIEAVKNHYSAAILQYVGEYPQVKGCNYRLNQYINFLLREYLPLRNELYLTEGYLMREYLSGTPGAKERLERTVKDHEYFEKKYFLR